MPSRFELKDGLLGLIGLGVFLAMTGPSLAEDADQDSQAFAVEETFDDAYWRAFQGGDFDLVVEEFALMVERTPSLIDWDHISVIARRYNDHSVNAKWAFMEAMVSYESAYGDAKFPDYVRSEYMLMLFDRGRHDEAFEQFGNLAGIEMRINILADRRYEAIWDRVGNVGNHVAAELERNLAEQRVLYTENDRQLSEVNALMQLLRMSGQTREAYNLGLAALSNPSYFEDAEDQLPWVRNEFSLAMIADGRIADAIEELDDTLAQNKGNEQVQINQRINVSRMKMRVGDYRGAITTVRQVPMDRVSSYAFSLIFATIVCSAHGLDNEAVASEIEEALTNLLTDIESGTRYSVYRAQIHTAVCRGDDDSAKDALVAWLEDPDARSEAFSMLQIYEPSNRQPGHDVRMLQTVERLREDADVMRLIQQHGRINSIPIDWASMSVF